MLVPVRGEHFTDEPCPQAPLATGATESIFLWYWGEEGQSLSPAVVKAGRWEGSVSIFVHFYDFAQVVFPSLGIYLGLVIFSVLNTENSLAKCTFP